MADLTTTICGLTFRNPVLLYSIGKDSSVLLHLAVKAFAPAPIPMPVMHVDTTWKFSEMIDFRDQRAAELGLDLRIATNEEAAAEGSQASPWSPTRGRKSYRSCTRYTADPS